MIYHITNKQIWEKSVRKGQYLPEHFEKDGFIHCSKKEQIINVANRFYGDQIEFLLLCIDENKVQAPIKYENLEGGSDLFPHIYGMLETHAVESIETIKKNESGIFDFPGFLTEK